MTRPLHFLNLQGASLLVTPYWAMAREGVLDAAAHHAITALTGPPGTGKTFLLDSVTPALDQPVLRIEPHDDPTMRSITIQMLEQLTGDEVRGSRHLNVRPLLECLRTPRVVMFDEAQRLNKRCLDHLRYLHDHADTRFTLVLAGGEGCWSVLCSEPQLKRRIWRPAFFKPLSGEEIQTLMPKFHPVWNTDPEVLDVINNSFGEGLLGNWASITKTATTSREDNDAPVTRTEIPVLLMRHGVELPSTWR